MARAVRDLCSSGSAGERAPAAVSRAVGHRDAATRRDATTRLGGSPAEKYVARTSAVGERVPTAVHRRPVGCRDAFGLAATATTDDEHGTSSTAPRTLGGATMYTAGKRAFGLRSRFFALSRQ
jgi:hypothetical protein